MSLTGLDPDDDAPPAEFAALPTVLPLDARQLRERTIRDYARNMGAPGMPSTIEEIERLAVADLVLSDAVTRDAPAHIPPTAAQVAEAKVARRQTLAEEQRAKGVELTNEAPRELGPQFDLPPEFGTSDRWGHAKGRLAAIVAGAGAPKRFASGAFDFRSMTSTCACPDLAYRFLAAWCDFDLRYVAQTAKHNPFFGMSSRDASLKLARVVEDLCDASTGRLGQWWVPK